MTDRASMFANPEIIALLQKNFVPVAIDVWYEQRRQDAVGEFFYNVVDQGRNKGRNRDLTRQGLYCFTADGVLLSDGNNRSPERLRELFNTALTKFAALPKNVAVKETLNPDQRFDRSLPPGTIVVNTFGKILLEGEAMQEALRINPRNASVSRDHLWVTAAELKAMIPSQIKVGFPYPVPRSLAVRLARFHLVDNVRGEPNLWNFNEVRDLKMNLEVEKAASNSITLKLSGYANLSTANADRTYEANLLGALVYDTKKQAFTRFDVLALGDASGAGTYTRGCPKGKFPLAIAFALADMNEVSRRVPPQGARSLSDYLAGG